jgi:hypothetical protein
MLAFLAVGHLYRSPFPRILLCQLHPADIVALVTLALVPVATIGAWHVSQPFPENRRFVTTSLVVMLVVSGLTGFYLFYQNGTNGGYPAAVACLVGAGATIGWLVQRQVSEDLSRKQHTLNILLQLRSNEMFARHRINLFQVYPNREVIPESDIVKIYDDGEKKDSYKLEPDGKQKFPLVESIRYIANYYEFLAAAVRHGDIDERLLRTSLEGIIKAAHKKFEAFFSHLLKRKNVDHPERYYENFKWLVEERWKEAPSPSKPARQPPP